MASDQKPSAFDPPPDWAPTQAVPEPVINNPYDEPEWHWTYIKGVPSKQPGRRRATYWFKSKKTGTAQEEIFAEEESDDLPLVNRLRSDVQRWRESGYRGASQVTRDLLSHWSSADLPRRLFFCQRESIETLIYLLEIAIPGRLSATRFQKFEVDSEDLQRLLSGEKPDFEEIVSEFYPRLVDPPADEDLFPLRRLGCKMATGTGKTVVMAMLIAWAFCNRSRNPATGIFPNAVLICAPNLTVRSRLQVLRPEDEASYYDEFDLVPARYRDSLNSGKILITNWHAFLPTNPQKEGDATYRVVDKGEEPNDAFTRNRLGDLADRVPLLVLNDEGHHCWRPAPGTSVETATKQATKDEIAEKRKELEDEAEEARVWLAGLDRINNSGLAGSGEPAVLACVDLSATPFHLANSGYDEGSPFPWLVSDFGLINAIECGIVKVPRLPVEDDTAAKDNAGRPDPKYYRLWKHIGDALKPIDKLSNGRPKPDAVYREAEGALLTLAAQWKERFDEIRVGTVGEIPVPPAMIVVCDNTEIAQVFCEKISGERVVEVLAEDGKKKLSHTVYEESSVLPEFRNTEHTRHTVRIDTDLLAKIETEEGQTKDEAAEALREIIDTVGRPGGPGEQVRCVVSVSMLTEGWDATNVTHILGVRAFGSQLLCEQVVGRGLRRISYLPDPETGRLPAEYVDVYGIPFSLIPFKGRTETKDRPDPIYHHIYALPERSALEIRMPVVESYTYGLRDSGIRCDVDSLEPLIVQEEPTEVFLAPTLGYEAEGEAIAPGEFVHQTREAYYQSVRLQQILFRIAQQLVDDLVQGAQQADPDSGSGPLYARHHLFPEVLRILQDYLDRKVTFAEGVDKREIGLEKYAKLLRERTRDGIVPAATSEDTPLLPILNSYRPTESTANVNYRTTRPVMRLAKSHLNLAMIQSEDERKAIEVLENMNAVEAFTPNDRSVGLRVPYEYQGAPHSYEPDFVVRMLGDILVMLEIKGGKGEIHDPDRVPAKNAAAKKWVAAVNNTGRHGRWAFEIKREKDSLRDLLSRHSDAEDILPFEIVTPADGDHYARCVPLVSLRAAAGHWSEEQQSLSPADWADEWVNWDGAPDFESGMFVARVQGDSMEPEIPHGAYCLFRPPPSGSRQGRRLLVWHSGIDDPHTGGQYTVKIYESEKASDPDTEWQHTTIRLKPLNSAYEPIVLRPQDEGEVRVIAEVAGVIGKPRSP